MMKICLVFSVFVAIVDHSPIPPILIKDIWLPWHLLMLRESRGTVFMWDLWLVSWECVMWILHQLPAWISTELPFTAKMDTHLCQYIVTNTTGNTHCHRPAFCVDNNQERQSPWQSQYVLHTCLVLVSSRTSQLFLYQYHRKNKTKYVLTTATGQGDFKGEKNT